MDYQVVKVFNNNVVLARQNKKEMILVSKGIGFGKKSGAIIKVNPKDIENIFHELNANDSSNYLDIIPKYDKEIVGVCEEIIAKAEAILGPLSFNIHTALVDHITFALDRIHMGLPIDNPFTEEITLLYQEEYDIAELAASLLKERLKVDIGDDEKGFIALHLHSARNNKTIHETMKDTRLSKALVDLIIKETDESFLNKNHVYRSFIPSIKVILYQCKNKKTMYNPLKKDIKNKMEKSYVTAEKIGILVKEEKGLTLSEDMIAYIAMDIEKICQF
ncbi:MAG: PRD domain-containing protein [Epulopiscium sp.]|nr:PRD domain-containing protein [Candidatus Epulonipiscium sp.]